MTSSFMPTTKKVLGAIILALLLSAVGLMPYLSDPLGFMTGQSTLVFGLPMPYMTLQGMGINNLNIVNLLIDIVIFYLAICVLSMAFKGRNDDNVPNSVSGRGDTSTTDKAGP